VCACPTAPLLLVDQAGEVLQSRDRGRSFRRLSLPDALPASGIVEAADGASDSLRYARNGACHVTHPPRGSEAMEPPFAAGRTICRQQSQRISIATPDRRAERLLFNNRLVVIVVCLLLTAVTGNSGDENSR